MLNLHIFTIQFSRGGTSQFLRCYFLLLQIFLIIINRLSPHHAVKVALDHPWRFFIFNQRTDFEQGLVRNIGGFIASGVLLLPFLFQTLLHIKPNQTHCNKEVLNWEYQPCKNKNKCVLIGIQILASKLIHEDCSNHFVASVP